MGLVVLSESTYGKRRGRRKSDLGAILKDAADVVRVPFSGGITWDWSSSTSVDDVVVDTTLTTAISTRAPTYEFYRYVKLEVEVYYVSAGTRFIIAYAPQLAGVSNITSAPGADSFIISMPYSASFTVPRVLKVPRSVLLSNPVKWFPTAISSTHYDDIQGTLHAVPYGSAITATLQATVKGIVEFKIPTISGGADLSGVTTTQFVRTPLDAYGFDVAEARQVQARILLARSKKDSLKPSCST